MTGRKLQGYGEASSLHGDMPISPHSNEELEARFAELMDANPEQTSTEVQVRSPPQPLASVCLTPHPSVQLLLSGNAAARQLGLSLDSQVDTSDQRIGQRIGQEYLGAAPRVAAQAGVDRQLTRLDTFKVGQEVWHSSVGLCLCAPTPSTRKSIYIDAREVLHALICAPTGLYPFMESSAYCMPLDAHCGSEPLRTPQLSAELLRSPQALEQPLLQDGTDDESEDGAPHDSRRSLASRHSQEGGSRRSLGPGFLTMPTFVGQRSGDVRSLKTPASHAWFLMHVQGAGCYASLMLRKPSSS